MKVVFFAREDLDGFASDAEAESFALSPYCHERSEQLVFHQGGVLAVRCRTCNRHVCNVAVDAPTQAQIEGASTPAEPARLKPSCHPKAGLHLTYGDGAIHVRCGRCRASIDRMTVRSHLDEVAHG